MTQRYPSYKDSSVQWLGEVPVGWQVPELKRFACLTYGDALASEIRDDDGEIPVYGSNGPVGTHSVANGFGPVILVGRKGSYGALNWCDSDCFAIDTVYLIDRRFANCDLRWLFWALHLARFDGSSQDTGVPGLSRAVAHLTRFPLPPHSEQTAIAAFLDRETAKIDVLVAEQRRLIELLREKRQAVISRAVTKGLNPNAPMKLSGIEWLGSVPEGWEVVPVKRLVVSFEQGWSPQCENVPAANGEWGVLKVGCVNGGQFWPEQNKALPASLNPVSTLAVAADDLLISRANTRELVGSAAVALKDFPNLMICDKLYRLRVKADTVDAHFLAMLLVTPYARKSIELEASGASASMVNISQSVIREMSFPIPPLNEQLDIMKFVQAQLAKLDTLTAAAETAIALLQERRSAVISAAVTGKIDVRLLSPVATEAA